MPVMVDTITGSEVAPTWAIWVSGKPNPSKTTAGLQNLLRCEFDSRRRAAFVFPEYADNHAGENGEYCAADDRNGGSQKPADSGERSANRDAGREGTNSAHGVLSRLEDGRRSSAVMGD